MVGDNTGTFVLRVYDEETDTMYLNINCAPEEGFRVFSGTFTIPNIDDNGNIGIILGHYGNKSEKVKAAKLELGPVQTLARQDADGNWVLNDPPDYDLQYALCSQYSPSTGEWVGYQHSNPNLLDNWYFADPINQRNETEYHISSGNASYCIDRWISGKNIKVELTNEGIVLTRLQNGYDFIAQIQSPELRQSLQGVTVTLSVLYKGGAANIGEVSGIESTLPASENYNIGSFTFTYRSGNAVFDRAPLIKAIDFDTPCTIKATKLELGPIQTLAHKDASGNWVLNDLPPNPALELAKCQRYQFVFGSSLAGASDNLPGTAISSTEAIFVIEFPLKLRAIPTFVVCLDNWGFAVIYKNTTSLKWLNQIDFTLSLASCSDKWAMVKFSTTQDLFEIGETVYLHTNEDTVAGNQTKKYIGKLIFDANL